MKRCELSHGLFLIWCLLWGCVCVGVGQISVVCWWIIWWGSMLGVLGLVAVIGRGVYCRLKQRKISVKMLRLLCVLLMMSYPFAWFFGVGQMAYPAYKEAVSPAIAIRSPFNQPVVVGWGGDALKYNRPHGSVPMERWAYDLLVSPFSVESSELKDYGIFGMAVYAPANGVVVEAYDKEKDCIPGKENYQTMAGNHVFIQLDETGTFLVMAHLQEGSLQVKAGQRVSKGMLLARVGNSGSSSEPHLHIHHQRQNPVTTNLFLAEGLPLYFESPWGPYMPEGGSREHVLYPAAE